MGIDTRDYVEQFLSDVAAGSGTLTSPYAVTGQYTDGSGRAAYKSLYGGGCIDYGIRAGIRASFGDTDDSGVGYGLSRQRLYGRPVRTSTDEFPDRRYGSAPNDICLTDAQIQDELAGSGLHGRAWCRSSGLLSRVESGYTPLLVV